MGGVGGERGEGGWQTDVDGAMCCMRALSSGVLGTGLHTSYKRWGGVGNDGAGSISTNLECPILRPHRGYQHTV